jgi:anthranilate synthase
MSNTRYLTAGQLSVERETRTLDYIEAIEPVVDALDSELGVLLASGYEYPGRYSRWDIGFVNPPLRLVGRGRTFELEALNPRGEVLLALIRPTLESLPAVGSLSSRPPRIFGEIREPEQRFVEEERSRQFSIFSLLRALIALFHSPEDSHVGLYGAFGYDLAFQFEPIVFNQKRSADLRDLVLYLPDEIVVVDHQRRTAMQHRYEFESGDVGTRGLPRTGVRVPYVPATNAVRRRDHEPGEYAKLVTVAHEWFRRGDLFEVVPSQTFYEPCASRPSEVFRWLREKNPAPYASLMNFGEGEYLVGASPEMYLRASGRRIETCPISGTIARGEDPIGDAEQILKLLGSEKEASELTMCTDVDRNDKSRVCEPGTVRVIGRRQIEMYSRLIHTVDHVEGILRPEFDALDGFLSHTWAVTVTGAPKTWAMRFIEDHERSSRIWYGGAIGYLGFDGNVNTGLTLRTMRIKDGIAEVRAGGTLLMDAEPAAEERETELKASALLDAVRRPNPSVGAKRRHPERVGEGKRVLLLDHEDSFVNTLGDYFRQTGADVVTLRFDKSRDERARRIREHRPNLLVLSPGPGTPTDFDVPGTVEIAKSLELPLFGVCLGFQGLVEACGGKLGILSYPMHGKTSEIRVLGGRLLKDLPETFYGGRYHSIYAIRDTLPAELELTAETVEGTPMAVEHRSLPMAAIQFHPESIMTLKDGIGLRIVENCIRLLVR